MTTAVPDVKEWSDNCSTMPARSLPMAGDDDISSIEGEKLEKEDEDANSFNDQPVIRQPEPLETSSSAQVVVIEPRPMDWPNTTPTPPTDTKPPSSTTPRKRGRAPSHDAALYEEMSRVILPPDHPFCNLFASPGHSDEFQERASPRNTRKTRRATPYNITPSHNRHLRHIHKDVISSNRLGTDRMEAGGYVTLWQPSLSRSGTLIPTPSLFPDNGIDDDVAPLDLSKPSVRREPRSPPQQQRENVPIRPQYFTNMGYAHPGSVLAYLPREPTLNDRLPVFSGFPPWPLIFR